MLKEKIKKLFEKGAELLYPERLTCNACGREVFHGEIFCAECERAIVRNDKYICKKCGRKILEDYPVCVQCKSNLPEYTAARSAFSYEGELVHVIRKFKTGAKYLARPFAEEMEAVYRREYGGADLIVPVPMTKRAERKRGYNQAALLARELSSRIGVECREDILEKIKDTGAQKALGLEDRLKNLAGSFHVHIRTACRNRTILLIDDVLTTGATAGAAARQLFKAGAARVLVLTAASVPHREENEQKI